MTFALEEKNLPYDSVLIDLRKKPLWYKDIVPTELTPAAVVNGELVYESLDILKVQPSYSCPQPRIVALAISKCPRMRVLLSFQCDLVLGTPMLLCACCCCMVACTLEQHAMWSPEASFALLKKLEAEFPEQQLLPEDAVLRDEAEMLMSQAEDFSTAGFR